MQIVKSCPASVLAHRAAEAATAAWIMIVILLGIAGIAIASLLYRV